MDETTGTSDVFIRAKLAGEIEESKVHHETLNPIFYEVLTMKDVELCAEYHDFKIGDKCEIKAVKPLIIEIWDKNNKILLGRIIYHIDNAKFYE